jgi:hypothetical protein
LNESDWRNVKWWKKSERNRTEKNLERWDPREWLDLLFEGGARSPRATHRHIFWKQREFCICFRWASFDFWWFWLYVRVPLFALFFFYTAVSCENCCGGFRKWEGKWWFNSKHVARGLEGLEGESNFTLINQW